MNHARSVARTHAHTHMRNVKTCHRLRTHTHTLVQNTNVFMDGVAVPSSSRPKWPNVVNLISNGSGNSDMVAHHATSY